MAMTSTTDSVDTVYNITCKFNDNTVCPLKFNKFTTVGQIVRMCVLHRCQFNKDLLDIVPDNIAGRCKLVFQGKVIVGDNKPLASVDGLLTPNAVIFCIMPTLTPTDIESIKSRIGPNDGEIAELLTSDRLRESLRTVQNFAYFSQLVGTPFTITESQIDVLLGSEAALNYLKSGPNYKQVTDWLASGAVSAVLITSATATTASASVDTPAPFEYQAQLDELVAMGIEANETNKNILRMFKGNLNDSVNEIFSSM
jgi:hypothetical protein